MAVPSHEPRARDNGVDLLRAVCILYIIGYWHLMPYTTALPGWANLYTESLTQIALATFVFCGGWLLAGRAVPLDAAGLWAFYRRRLLRIVPLYLLALVLFWLADIAPVEKLIDGALLVSMFRPPPLPTLWFITMIMVFYLIAPLVIRAAERPAVWLLLTVAVGLALGLWHLFGAPIDLRMLTNWPIFALGVLVRRQPLAFDRLASPRTLAALALAVPVALWLARHGNQTTIGGVALLWPNAIIGTVLLFRLAPALARRLPAAPILFVATASYVLYLIHRVTFKGLIALYFPESGWGQAAYLWLVALPLTLVLAWWIQRTYDRLLTPPRGATA